MTTRTERNLWSAFLVEAKANRMYVAYAQQAMVEGHPEAAQVFMEAAGAETIHALNHLQALGQVRSTPENLRAVTEDESYEFQVMYPRMIDDAQAEGRPDAVASFRLALEGEQHHHQLFLAALRQMEAKLGQRPPIPTRKPTAPRPPEVGTAPETGEVYREKGRIAALTRIREVVFGMQDGLLSIAALAASVAGAVAENRVVVIAGLAAALAGMLSMAAGSYLGSKAEREVQTAELEQEAREIEANPAEEMAELIEIYRQEGFSYQEAVEMAERVTSDRQQWLAVMAEKELGISPELMTNPALDAAAMGASFIVGGIIPLLPYFFLAGGPAIGLSVGLAVSVLFAMGAVKAVLVRRNPIISGLEMMAVGSAVAAAGYVLGRTFPAA